MNVFFTLILCELCHWSGALANLGRHRLFEVLNFMCLQCNRKSSVMCQTDIGKEKKVDYFHHITLGSCMACCTTCFGKTCARARWFAVLFGVSESIMACQEARTSVDHDENNRAHLTSPRRFWSCVSAGGACCPTEAKSSVTRRLCVGCPASSVRLVSTSGSAQQCRVRPGTSHERPTWGATKKV